MVTQEIIHYPDSFNVKEYKEYHNGVLNVHSKYDEHNNKVYLYLAYENLEWERRFEDGTSNNNGKVIYYKDNKNNYKIRKDSLIFDINKVTDVRFGDDYYRIKIEEQTGLDTYKRLVDASANKFNGVYFCTYYRENLPNGDGLKYSKNYFMEIYYEYFHEGKYTGNRKMISFDELIELTRYKDFLVEHKICPVNRSYFIGGNHSKNLSRSLFITD